jgi:pseudouridine-5'-phosphate glycosidase
MTLEYLETHGVPVLGCGCAELPAFYTRRSGFPLEHSADSPRELAAVFRAQRDLDMPGGTLVLSPIPEEYSMNPRLVNDAVDKAVAEARSRGIRGKALTPFLLAAVRELTGGSSLESHIGCC